jgi:hypothetical protein
LFGGDEKSNGRAQSLRFVFGVVKNVAAVPVTTRYGLRGNAKPTRETEQNAMLRRASHSNLLYSQALRIADNIHLALHRILQSHQSTAIALRSNASFLLLRRSFLFLSVCGPP